MDYIELRIDGVVADVSYETLIGLTLKANDVGDPTARWIASTNQFMLPFTPKNDLIYQNARLVNSNTLTPYRKQYISIKQNGIEILTNALSYLKKADDGYEVQVFENQWGFFQAIEGKKVSDLDLSVHDDVFDPDTKMNTTSGVIFPVINYGDFDGSTIPADTNLPSFYLHTIMDRIFVEAGYMKAGKVFSKNKYLRMVIPFSRSQFGYADSFTKPLEFSAINVGDQVQASPVGGEVILFQKMVKQSDFYDIADSEYSGASVVSFQHFFAEIEWTQVGGSSFDLRIMADPATIIAQVTCPSGAGGRVVMDSRIMFPDGVPINDVNEVKVIFSPGNLTAGTVTLRTRTFYNIVQQRVYQFGVYDIAFGKLLPDMLISDLLTDFMIRFNLITRENNGTITFKSIDDVIRDVASSKDWTGKRVDVKDDLGFTPLDYAQRNVFRYSNNDDNVNALLGSGTLTIDNDNIRSSKDIYQSPFNNAETSLKGEINVAKIPIYETSTSRSLFDEEPGLHLLLVRQKKADEPSVNGVSAYKVAYFEDALEEYSMSMQQALDDNYSLFQAILQRAKLVKREYLLKEIDIVQFTFLFPIFDKDSYFLINTIGPFVYNKTCDVEMLRIHTVDLPPVIRPLVLNSQYIDNVAATPMWDVYYDNDMGTTHLASFTGSGTDAEEMPFNGVVHVNVLKLSNLGIAQGNGSIDFRVNGVTVNNIPFSNGDNVAGNFYSFTGLSSGDELTVVVTEG